MIRRILLCTAVAVILTVMPVYADYNIDTSDIDNALKGEYSSLIGEQNTQDPDFKSGVASLLRNALKTAKQKLKDSCRVCFLIVICCALTSLVRGFSQVAASKIAVKITDYTGAFAAMCIALSSVGGMLSKCIDAINDISSFSKIVTPVFAVAAAVSQHPSAAVSTAGASLLFNSVFTTVTLDLFMPLIVMYIVANTVGAVSELDILNKLCELIRWFLSFCWKVLLIAFISYISVSGIISSGADAVSIKTARIVLNSSIPIVGSIIADASDAILSGATIVKNSVGIIGLLGVSAICLVPFVGCFIYQTVFKITAAVSSSLCGGAMTKVLDGIGSAYGLALAALGACCMVQFVSVVIMSAVTMV